MAGSIDNPGLIIKYSMQCDPIEWRVRVYVYMCTRSRSGSELAKCIDLLRSLCQCTMHVDWSGGKEKEERINRAR